MKTGMINLKVQSKFMKSKYSTEVKWDVSPLFSELRHVKKNM